MKPKFLQKRYAESLLVVGATLVGMCLAVSGAAFAQAELPSVRFRSAPLITPSDAATYYSGVSISGVTPIYYCNGQPSLSSCTGRPAEIQEVAVGLGANRLPDDEFVRNAFEYVYNTIEITPTFGLSKGALGAMIDRYGTSFDQANLLVELLKVDTTVTATYQYGDITLTPTEFMSWLGSPTPYAACKLLANGGIPGTVAGTQNCDSLDGVAWGGSGVEMSHIWVQATTATSTFTLDPAFKSHTVTAGVSNLSTAMGYNAADFYQASTLGADISATQVRRLHHFNINDRLASYSSSLNQSVYSANPNARPEDVIGGRDITPKIKSGSLDLETRPYNVALASTSASWASIPDAYRTVLSISYGDVSRKIYADQVYGRNLTIQNFTEISRAAIPPTLFIDDLALAQASAIDYQFTVLVNHPYAAEAGAFMDESITKTLGNGILGSLDNKFNNVSIVVGLGSAAKARVEHSRKRMTLAALPLSLSAESKRVAHRLQRDVMITEWLAQVSQLGKMLEGVVATAVQHHHSIGYVNDITQAYDTQTSKGNAFHFDVDSALSLAPSYIDVNREKATRIALAATSAQLEGMNAGMAIGSNTGGSVPRALQVAIGGVLTLPHGYSGPFLAEHFSPGDLYTYGIADSSDLSVITATSTASARAFMGQYLDSSLDYRIITPQSQNAIGTGMNFLAVSADGQSIAHMVRVADVEGLFIKGGFAEPPDTSLIKPGAAFDPRLRNDLSTNMSASGLSVSPISGEPSLTQTDIVAGNGPFPYSLPFTRSYSIDDRIGAAQALPGGWRHNYQLNARVTSDVLAGLGAGSDVPAAAAIPMIVALHTAIDQMAQVDLATSSQGLVRTILAEAAISQQSLGMHANSYIAETFEGPKQFWNGRPRVGSNDTMLGADSTEPGVFGMTLVTKEGVLYTYGNLIKNYHTGVGGSFVIGTDCELQSGLFLPAPAFGDPLLGALQSVKWPSGVRIDIEHRADCYSPIAKVTNNLGRTLNISARSGSNSITVDDGPGGRQIVVSPTQVTLPDGRNIKYVFDGAWRSPLGLALSQNLTGSRLKSVSLPLKPNAAFSAIDYDSLNRVSTVTDALGRVSRFGAGGLWQNFRQETQDALFNRSSQYFDSDRRSIHSVDPLQRHTVSSYDAAGRLSAVRYPEGNGANYEYDSRNNLIKTTQIGKNSGDPQFIKLSLFATTCTVDVWAIPACDAPVWTDDARGARTYFSYTDDDTATNSRGLLKVVKAPCPSNGTCGESDTNRPTTTYSYNSVGQPTVTKEPKSEGNPTGTFSTFTYAGAPSISNAGNLIATTVDTGASPHKNLKTVFYYDAVGNVCKQVGPRGSGGLDGTESGACTGSQGGDHATKFEYDPNRRLVNTITTLGANTYNSRSYLNANGWPEVVAKFANGTMVEKTVTTYYDDGKVDEVSNADCYDASLGVLDPNCARTKSTYDEAGRLKTVMDPMGRVTRTEYDAAGQVIKVIGADGTSQQQQTATYAYTPNGKRHTAMDANGNVSEYKYDGHDRLFQLHYPDVNRTCSAASPCTWLTPGGPSTVDYEQYEYDANGNMIWKRTREHTNKVWIKRSFDALNRETTRTTLTGCPNIGNSELMSGAGLGCLTGSTQRAVATAYDLASHVTAVTRTANGNWFSDEPVVSYGYDTAGRRISESFQTDTGDTAETFDLTLDEAGNTVVIKYPGNDNYEAYYQYDALNRVTAIGTTAGGMAEYGYDALGRRQSQLFANGRVAQYQYWPDSTLKQVKQVAMLDHDSSAATPRVDAVWDFHYTAANQVDWKMAPEAFRWQPGSGQAGVTAYTVNGLNQYATVNAVAQMYDKNGNMTSDGAGWTYAYDAENRMIEADHPTATAGTPVTNAKYDYDAIDRRFAKVVDTGTEVSTRYLWLGENILAEYDGASGALLRRYVHGPGVDEPIAEVNYAPAAGTYFYHADHLGSIVARTNATGEIAANDTYAYSAHGEPDKTQGAMWRYTGRQLDAETGLYYYRARMYNPALGRFMQIDPMGDVDSLNLYQYALWDPINKRDPSGLTPGDPFLTSDEAAIDAINFINPQSISEAIEYGGSIIEKDGMFYATNPIKGTVGSVPSQIFKGQVGQYHTHGDYVNRVQRDGKVVYVRVPRENAKRADDFSPGDKAGAQENRRITKYDNYKSYVGTPSQAVKVYDAKTGAITTIQQERSERAKSDAAKDQRNEERRCAQNGVTCVR